jgi:hypothetical protein
MRYLPAAFVALTLCIAPALSAPAFAAAPAADPDAPSYDKGTVWDFGLVQTKDGHFDDYMKWLAGQWKAQEEALKKAGRILSYKVLIVADPRKDEPDIILATEYPNMAAFDHSAGDEYALQKSIFGPLSKATSEQAARGSIRTIVGDILVREAILK